MKILRLVVTLALVLQLAYGTSAIASDSSNNKMWLLRPIERLLTLRLESALVKAREEGWNFHSSLGDHPISDIARLKDAVTHGGEIYLSSSSNLGRRPARFRVNLMSATPKSIHIAMTSLDQKAVTDFVFDSSSLLSYKSTGRTIQDQILSFAEGWVELSLDAKSRGPRVYEEPSKRALLETLLAAAHAADSAPQLLYASVARVATGLELAAAVTILIAALSILNTSFASGSLIIGASLALSRWLVQHLPRYHAISSLMD